jgi:hypothetical protein
MHAVTCHLNFPSIDLTCSIRACLYDPGQAGRDAYRDPARNTNSKECLYDPATYPA